MTDTTLREKIAHAMWRNQAERVATPSTIRGRTPEAFAEASDETRREWLGYADAALAVISAPAVPDDVATHPQERAIAQATIEAQAAELARYQEALGPFAAVAEHDIGDDETDGEAFRPMQFLNRAPKLTVGDLRRARAALTHPTGD